MIGKLKGILDTNDQDFCIIDVGGVGYNVFCSARTLANLPGIGEKISLIIETHVREEHIHLFGFPDPSEREWFRTLISVQGVGVKMAIAILGIFSPAELANAIAAKDTKSLIRVSGVGAKLAERLVIELKNKIAKLPTGSTAFAGDIKPSGKAKSPLPAASVNEDAVSALVNLGYSRSDAYNAVLAAIARIGQEGEKIDILIKESLRELAKRTS